jgi:hypothetical protein
VIRRELVFREGECYDPVLLRESERVLRASEFIAEVDIFGVQQPDGTYHVIVDTRDEWSTRVEVQTGAGTGVQLTGIALREDNLLGTGRRAAAFYSRAHDARVYGLSYVNPQIFHTRWQAGFEVGRTPLGTLFRQTVDYPFVGETGRSAFRHHLEHHDRYFGYLVERDGGLIAVQMPERRRSFDVGVARRFGPRGSLTLLGIMLAGNWISYPGAPRVSDLSGAAVDSLVAPIAAQLDSVADVRASLLFGQRNVYFTRRRGFDTVNGIEDVRLGVEMELGVGNSIRSFSSGHDLSLDVGFFLAEEIGSLVVAGGRVAAEARRNYQARADAPEWDDVFAQLDVWAYVRAAPESRHTLVAALAGSGGWNHRIPFQLTLGGGTGLRGQPFQLMPGAQRLVASLEARSYLGWPYAQLFDLGTVAFVDAGRIWAGEAPFGVDSRWHANLGVGIRGAFPPGSHNTLRVDVAAPLRSGAGFSDLVFSVGTRQAIGRAPRWDGEMTRSSRRGSTASLFGVRSDREP